MGGVEAVGADGASFWQDAAQGPAPHAGGDHLAAPERGDLACKPSRAWDVMGAAQTFIRWGKQGDWERLLTLAQERVGGAGLGVAPSD